jgi:hypothetical protein
MRFDVTRYVHGGDACSNFMRCDLSFREYDVSDDMEVSQLITRHVGESPRFYSRDDLAEARFEPFGGFSGADVSREELLKLAERLAADRPSLYLVDPCESLLKGLPFWKGCLREAQVKDGDVLLVGRNSPTAILGSASSLHQRPAVLDWVPDAHEFFEAISSQPAKPEPKEWYPDGRHQERFARPVQIALLYTEDDADVAAYVRTHYHELDIASGAHCNLYFVENPGVIAPVRYWRPLLGAKLHAAWKLLGWASSAPYDKAHVYDIARQLGVRFDQLPCAVVLVPGSSEVSEIVPLQRHLSWVLRGLLARFQGPPDPEQYRGGPRAEQDGGSPRAACSGPIGPMVFLSHAPADEALVRSVAVQLQSYGIEAWFDQWQIRAGESTTLEIERGLARAEIVVLFLSRSSLASNRSKAEMRAVLHAQIEKRQYRAVIPVIVDDCEIPALLRDCHPIRSTEPAYIVEELRTAVKVGARSPAHGLELSSPKPPTRHTILFLAANPSGTDPRALDREARAIQVELERSGFRDRFELVTRWAAEPLDLLRELRKLKPTVVHFSGRGAPAAEDASQYGPCFQGPDGRAQLVSTEALQETFGAAGASVKLVVLSACYSEVQARTLLPHVGCVVGMSGSVLDDAARSFAIGFYGGLGERESVAAAYEQGCAAISLDGLRARARPQLAVRADVDAGKLVLAADSRPRSKRPASLSRAPELGSTSTRSQTTTALSTPLNTPPLPEPRAPGDVQGRAGLMERARRWRWVLACVLLAIAIVAALALS